MSELRWRTFVADDLMTEGQSRVWPVSMRKGSAQAICCSLLSKPVNSIVGDTKRMKRSASFWSSPAEKRGLNF